MVSISQAPIFRWVVAPRPDRSLVLQLAERLHLPEALAALLVQRGQSDAEGARRYLRPALGDLADPFALAGMAEAVDAVTSAVRAGGTIMVHGDYDVDGQCATAVLTRALHAAGADVVPFVPHRLRDGYDFGTAGLTAARAAGASLVITCDCGITAVETVREARAAGIGVVVTDHHLPGDELPPAVAVVDPQRPDDVSGLSGLCGTGVAFKLVQALVPALNLPVNLPYYLLDMVALATVADVVPLQGENRILVKHGLRLLAESNWPGVRALVEACGLAKKEIRAGHLGFILGPRLNAAGRLDDMSLGIECLLCENEALARDMAVQLDQLNQDRKAIEQGMQREALAQLKDLPVEQLPFGLCLFEAEWHQGVIGILASRLKERYHRPTIAFADAGDGLLKGSARSVPGFHIRDALDAVAARHPACKADLVIVDVLAELGPPRHDERTVTGELCLEERSRAAVADDRVCAYQGCAELVEREAAEVLAMARWSARTGLDDNLESAVPVALLDPAVDPLDEPVEGMVVGADGGEDAEGVITDH